MANQNQSRQPQQQPEVRQVNNNTLMFSVPPQVTLQKGNNGLIYCTDLVSSDKIIAINLSKYAIESESQRFIKRVLRASADYANDIYNRLRHTNGLH